MFTILYHLKNRYMSQKAQGIVEYALILAFVVVVAAVLVGDNSLGSAIKGIFGAAKDQVQAGATNAGNAGGTTGGTTGGN